MRRYADNDIVVTDTGRDIKRRQFAITRAKNDFCINLFISAEITVFARRTDYQISFQTFFLAALANVKSRLPAVGDYKSSLGYKNNVGLLRHKFLQRFGIDFRADHQCASDNARNGHLYIFIAERRQQVHPYNRIVTARINTIHVDIPRNHIFLRRYVGYDFRNLAFGLIIALEYNRLVLPVDQQVSHVRPMHRVQQRHDNAFVTRHLYHPLGTVIQMQLARRRIIRIIHAPHFGH